VERRAVPDDDRPTGSRLVYEMKYKVSAHMGARNETKDVDGAAMAELWALDFRRRGAAVVTVSTEDGALVLEHDLPRRRHAEIAGSPKDQAPTGPEVARPDIL